MGAYLKLVIKLTDREPDLAWPVLVRFYQAEMEYKTKAIEKKPIMLQMLNFLLSVDELRSDDIEKFGEFFAFTDFGVDFALYAENYLTKVERNEVLTTNVLNMLSLLAECLPDDEVDVMNCMDPRSKEWAFNWKLFWWKKVVQNIK